MSKKSNTAAALAGILQAKRGVDLPAVPEVAEAVAVDIAPPSLPSPAPVAAPPRVEATKPESAALRGRGGKSSDPNYSQYSVYLRKTIRKKVGRALDDADTGQDFSELVEELLEKWLASRT